MIRGKRPRRHWRTASEPWIAVGTTGAPDSRASRPRPGRGSPSPPERERPPSNPDAAAASEDRAGGRERLVVAVAAAHREVAGDAKQVAERRVVPEQLRLRHEPDPASQVHAAEEVVHVGEVVGGEDEAAARRHVVADGPGPEGRARPASAGRGRPRRSSPARGCAPTRGRSASTRPGAGPDSPVA